MFLMEEVLGSKNLQKLFEVLNNLRFHLFPDPVDRFGPLAAIMNFALSSLLLMEGVLRSKTYITIVFLLTIMRAKRANNAPRRG